MGDEALFGQMTLPVIIEPILRQVCHHISTRWRCAGYFFKVLLKFKMDATDQFQFFCGHKNLEVGNYSIFTILFPTIWKCGGDFFRVFLKCKMAAMDELHNFFVVAKNQKLRSEIIHILQSHYPPSGNVQVILPKFKMATTSRLF